MGDAVARSREWREMLGEQPVKGPPDRGETTRRALDVFTPGEDERGLLYRFEGRGRSAAYWPAF